MCIPRKNFSIEKKVWISPSLTECHLEKQGIEKVTPLVFCPECQLEKQGIKKASVWPILCIFYACMISSPWNTHTQPYQVQLGHILASPTTLYIHTLSITIHTHELVHTRTCSQPHLRPTPSLMLTQIHMHVHVHVTHMYVTTHTHIHMIFRWSWGSDGLGMGRGYVQNLVIHTYVTLRMGRGYVQNLVIHTYVTTHIHMVPVW